MATIGDRIFFARREKDITQEELASAVGINTKKTS